MTISFIVAVSENNVIGKDNKLPWQLPTDMKYFKNVTWAMPVIMGRKSYEALGEPLRGRTNIVVTRNKDWTAEGVQTVSSVDQAITLAAQTDAREIFIIGGAEIFQAALPSADRIYLTLVHGTFDGDAFFPGIKQEDWELVSNRECEPDAKNAYALSFQVWERKLPSHKGAQIHFH
ncbi:MAG TPA: dihydrofolate reductase [Chitinophagaceae bacterium]|nr:dihydrofolate reductase [Chitinophagaceae bacterium]